MIFLKLKVLKSINKRIITLEIETTEFTYDKNKILNIFEEPVVSFKKVYGTNLAVKIEKTIRTGFKVKVKFDGTDDIVAADKVSYQFLEDLPERK